MRRILLVSGELPPGVAGGVASWAGDLARALSGQGHAVLLMGPASRGGDAAAIQTWDRAQPFEVRRFPARSWRRWQAWWVELHARPRLHEVDAVIFATWELATRLGPVARRRGLPVALAFHGSDLTRLRAPDAAFRATMAAATARLPVSAFLGQELARLGSAATAVLPMPLDLAGPEPGPGPRGPELLTVARLTPLKGVDRAIRLAQRLQLGLAVVGDGPERARLQALAGPETRFLGPLDRVATRAAYRSARACLLLSRAEADGTGAEGLGLTLLEAMVQGCPAVGAPTGGIPEALGPGHLLLQPEDPDLDGLRAYLDDPEAGPRGQAWVRAQHGPQAATSVLLEALG